MDSLADYLRRGPRFAGFDSDGDKKFSVDIVRSVGARSVGREAREYKLRHSLTRTQVRMAKEMSSAVAHLHTYKVCHKDLNQIIFF